MAWNDDIFREKMDKLNSSQLSIENTSQWMRFYRADARRVADCWETYFSKADQPKRLAMVYLANDVVQNSRKNAREFLEAFFRVLPRALHHMLAKSDEKTRAAVHKVIRVWDERKVFGTSGSRALHELLQGSEAVASPRSAPQQPQQPQQPQPQPPQVLDLSALAPQLAGALQQAGAAAQQYSQLQTAVGAALPVALGPAATAQQLAAARAAVQGLSAALQQQASSSHTAAGLLRQMLAEQEHAATQASALLQTCSQHLAQLDTRAAAAAQQAQQSPPPSQQPGGASEPAVAAPQQPVQAQANGQQQQQQGKPVPPPQQGPSPSEEAASLAAALANTENSAEALMAAFMELPPDQQEGLGVELASLLQQPPGSAPGSGGGDDLYDPEDL